MAYSPPDPEDQRLFQEQMADAKPLISTRAEPFRRRLPPHPLLQPDYLRKDAEANPALSEAEVETTEYLLFARPGLQQRVLHDLKRGALPVELEVDLHGLTVSYAEETLDAFFQECRRRRIRCARVIHGKGRRSEGQQPVLKQKVNYWLRLREDVLAFCSTLPRDGGSGAVYLLLRNPSKSRPK